MRTDYFPALALRILPEKTKDFGHCASNHYDKRHRFGEYVRISAAGSLNILANGSMLL